MLNAIRADLASNKTQVIPQRRFTAEVRCIGKLWNDDHGKNSEDDHDDQNLDQCESVSGGVTRCEPNWRKLAAL